MFGAVLLKVSVAGRFRKKKRKKPLTRFEFSHRTASFSLSPENLCKAFKDSRADVSALSGREKDWE